MNLLFIHQNFPGQFKHLAPALVRAGHRVLALVLVQGKGKPPAPRWQGVEIVPYTVDRGSTPGIHPWLIDFESKTIRGQGCLRAFRELDARGFVPDVVISHPGWGESLFVKDVWPHTRLGIYCEFFYREHGADVGFDPEFRDVSEEEASRLRYKNLNLLLHFDIADGGIAPTRWQADTFPESFRSRISVIHEGVDTTQVAPDPAASLSLRTADGRALRLTRDDELVTFVNRNLEPYRGYHVFMRALPELLRRRPRARVLLVGGNGASYGAPPPEGNWKEFMIREVRGQISDADWARVHFLGNLPYRHFLSVLQLSTVHVYYTYPFILSWSLIEAMSTGCAIVASDTGPLREVIEEDVTGRRVEFFDVAGLVEAVSGLLGDPAARERLGRAARERAVALFDARGHCLPRQLQWVETLARGGPALPGA